MKNHLHSGTQPWSILPSLDWAQVFHQRTWPSLAGTGWQLSLRNLAWKAPAEGTAEPSASAPGRSALSSSSGETWKAWYQSEGKDTELAQRFVARYQNTQEVIREKAFCFNSTYWPFVGEFSVKQQHLLNTQRDGFVTWGKDAASKYNWCSFPAFILHSGYPFSTT